MGRWTRQLWTECTRPSRISHDYCAPVFGRKQWRERSGQYLQALLVQSQERRNAENLSETVTASPRVLQRFLTEARWDDDAGHRPADQEYLGSRLEHPQAVWVLDGSDFPKQGMKSAGVARQYTWSIGEDCQPVQAAGVLGPRGAPGPGAGGQEAVSAPGMDWGLGSVVRWRGCRRTGGSTKARRSWPWICWSVPRPERHLSAQWVAGDSAFGMSPTLREGLASAGMYYVLDVRPDMTVWPLEPTWTDPPYQGNGAFPANPDRGAEERRTMS